ncbi:hypothetical protein H8356DRAFT_1325247, partial [Neocallimastix lanati (nom. inval.)]
HTRSQLGVSYWIIHHSILKYNMSLCLVETSIWDPNNYIIFFIDVIFLNIADFTGFDVALYNLIHFDLKVRSLILDFPLLLKEHLLLVKGYYNYLVFPSSSLNPATWSSHKRLFSSKSSPSLFTLERTISSNCDWWRTANFMIFININLMLCTMNRLDERFCRFYFVNAAILLCHLSRLAVLPISSLNLLFTKILITVDALVNSKILPYTQND